MDAIPLPFCVMTNNQTKGKGSRGNGWIGKKGNLFFSFVVDKSLFKEVPLQSLSIYFGYLMKETLADMGYSVSLKWPNDLYLEKKVGGVITTLQKKSIICGIGINTKVSIASYDCLNMSENDNLVLSAFFKKVEKKETWKQVLSKYKVEFYAKNYTTSDNIKLKNALLEEDGSIRINGQRKYSLR